MFRALWQNLVTRFRKCLGSKFPSLTQKEEKVDIDRETLLFGAEGKKARQFGRDLARALDGDASAMYEVSCHYEWGYGVDENEAEAFRWLELAAEAGSDAAQNELGLRYLNGWDVPQNFKLALKYLTAASRSPEYWGMNEDVGVMYLNGIGCKRDLQLAAKYFAHICNDRDLESYRQGVEFEKLGQYEEAKKEYLWAIRSGNQEAAINFERMIREGIVQLQSPEFTDGWFNFCRMQPY